MKIRMFLAISSIFLFSTTLGNTTNNLLDQNDIPISVYQSLFGFYGQADTSLGLSSIGQNQKIPQESPSTFYDTFEKSTSPSTAFSFGVQVGIATKIHPKSLLEIGIELNQSTKYSATGKIHSSEFSPGKKIPDDSHKYDYKYNVQLFRGMVVGRIFYHFTPKFSPFLSAGTGISIINATDFSTTRATSAATKNYSKKFSDKTTSNFAWQLGGGVNYQITDRTAAILGYRYVNFGKIEMTDHNHPTKPLRLGFIDTHELYLGIHFRI